MAVEGTRLFPLSCMWMEEPVKAIVRVRVTVAISVITGGVCYVRARVRVHVGNRVGVRTKPRLSGGKG